LLAAARCGGGAVFRPRSCCWEAQEIAGPEHRTPARRRDHGFAQTRDARSKRLNAIEMYDRINGNSNVMPYETIRARLATGVVAWVFER
jgi:hypothetical protein